MGEQDPFEPDVTSLNVDDESWVYGKLFVADAALPASAYTDAMIGDDTLVPPNTSQPEKPW